MLYRMVVGSRVNVVSAMIVIEHSHCLALGENGAYILLLFHIITSTYTRALQREKKIVCT